VDDPRTSDTAQTERRRELLLERTAEVYAAYKSSGYADRWSDRGGVRFGSARLNKWIADAIDLPDLRTVVDLGCGNGATAVELDRQGRRPERYVGIDLLADRIEVARDRATWAEFHVASADRLPFEGGEVDAVLAITLLSSLTEAWFRHSVAEEVDRIIRPGGRLLVYDIRYPSWRNRNVRPVSKAQLASLFPTWRIDASSLTLMPPLARSWIGASRARYEWLNAIPILRSHIGAVLTKP
jgi:ubiquinone/menaquinone biosynthesis C-methylase UbiE